MASICSFRAAIGVTRPGLAMVDTGDIRKVQEYAGHLWWGEADEVRPR
jgi:hypothetical protein